MGHGERTVAEGCSGGEAAFRSTVVNPKRPRLWRNNRVDSVRRATYTARKPLPPSIAVTP